MESLAESMPGQAAMPRFEDGSINPRELKRRLAEDVVNAIMDAEADQLCAGGANSRNGYRERNLATCMGDITLRIPKLRTGSFFPEDVVGRYQRVDRAVVAAAAEMSATGTSTRKAQRVAELLGRDLGGSRTPYLWLDATYIKCRRDDRVASTAVVTAIGCDEGGWRRVLGLAVVDTESYDSWAGFLRGIRDRGVHGVRLVTSGAHKGLVRAMEGVFQGASWQRCAVHLMRDCMREAGSRSLKRRVGRIMSPVFRAKDAATARAMYHVTCDMLREYRPKAADRRRREGRARRAGVPSVPAFPLEAAAHEQRVGAGQPRDQAAQPRRAGVPVREIARAPGRGRDVRARRAVVRVALLRLREDPGVLRRATRGRGRARKARGRARGSRQEDDRREHGACGKGGCGVAWPIRFRDSGEGPNPQPSRIAVRSGCLRQRLARPAYTNFSDATAASLSRIDSRSSATASALAAAVSRDSIAWMALSMAAVCGLFDFGTFAKTLR